MTRQYPPAVTDGAWPGTEHSHRPAVIHIRTARYMRASNGGILTRELYYLIWVRLKSHNRSFRNYGPKTSLVEKRNLVSSHIYKNSGSN